METLIRVARLAERLARAPALHVLPTCSRTARAHAPVARALDSALSLLGKVSSAPDFPSCSFFSLVYGLTYPRYAAFSTCLPKYVYSAVKDVVTEIVDFSDMKRCPL